MFKGPFHTYSSEGEISNTYFFMTKKSVRLLPRPAGFSLAGSTSGYSSWAPGNSGTSAVKARCTVITLGCTDSLLGSTPKSLHGVHTLQFTSKSTFWKLWNKKGALKSTHPCRVICSFSGLRAIGPAGTSSCDMDLMIASLDDPICKATVKL